MRKYRDFELRRAREGVYGRLEREKSRVVTPVCDTQAACRRMIDDFYGWEMGMNGGKSAAHCAAGTVRGRDGAGG
nr:MAG TPA: hypothetical protein [Caudoviricetes sp.]